MAQEAEPHAPMTELKMPVADSKTSKKEKKAAADNEAEPWLVNGWFRGNDRFKSPILQLHKEIVDFCDFLSPTPEEQASRNAAIECVFDVIKYIWPNCKVIQDRALSFNQ